MKAFSTISVLAFCGMIVACSGSEFKTGSTQTGEGAPTPDPITIEDIESTSDQAPIPGFESPGESPAPATTGTPLTNEEDKSALNECIKQWGSSPFTPQEIAQPKVVDISAAVNNNQVIYTDDKVTAKPTLFLVNFNINVGNNGQLSFMNPKGWYCFNVKAKVINNFTINAACETHVAIVSKQAQNDKNFTIARQEPCPAAP